MKRDRFSTTIEFVLLICFTLASVLFEMELYIGKHASLSLTLFIGLGLLIALLLIFIWVNRVKSYVALRRIILCFSTILLFGFTVYSNVQRTHQENNQQLKTSHQVHLVTLDSQMSEGNDLKSKVIGYVRSDRLYIQGLIEADETSFEELNLVEYDDFSQLEEALKTHEIHGSLLGTLNYELLCRDSSFLSFHHVIESYEYQTSLTHSYHEVDVSSQPFTVFVSLMLSDLNVEIAQKNDFNFIIYMNPIQKRMHVQMLPSDLYIPNLAYDGYSDRLDHLGYSGMDNVLFSIESMVGFKFDYFMKMNLISLENVTESIDGIEVSFDEAFCKESEACITSLDLSLNKDNIRTYVEGLKQYPDIFLKLFQGFFEKKQALNIKNDTNLLTSTKSHVFSDIQSATLLKMQNNYVNDDWVYSDEIIEPLLKVSAPCISWDFYDLQEVSIIDTESSAQVYERYLMNMDLTEMSRFAISLDQLQQGRVLPKTNEAVVNATNVREKITAFYTILPNISIHPIEVNKWNDPVLNEAHFNPDSEIEKIENYTE